MTQVRTANGATAAPRRARRASSAGAVMCFDVEVKRVQRLSGNFQRITFAGDCLSGFGVQGATNDLRIKVVVPSVDADGRQLPMPVFDCSDTGWYRNWLQLDAGVRGSMRTYTVRSARCAAAEPEIDVDFVLHFDEHGRGGPASSWAAAAQPGTGSASSGRMPPTASPPRATAESSGGREWRSTSCWPATKQRFPPSRPSWNPCLPV
ncbi:siderophore-interacting protein [Arthrobacter sp. ATA002]|uniref:siderophore-interacting protein n=1 Tax=Arthrobacter sp. ATA002 TaxID=2991715 RepID=UPI003FA45C13